MQIKVEIDVKPEELRRFLGLPDVAGLQDDVVRFLREKVSAASENFDPAAVVQGSLDLIKRTPAWRRLRGALSSRDSAAATGTAETVEEAVAEAAETVVETAKPRPPRRSARKTAAAGKAAKAPAKRAAARRRGKRAKPPEA